ncbi:MAG: hypothetical protein WDW38_006953 [Sanguina aurantia]
MAILQEPVHTTFSKKKGQLKALFKVAPPVSSADGAMGLHAPLQAAPFPASAASPAVEPPTHLMTDPIPAAAATLATAQPVRAPAQHVPATATPITAAPSHAPAAATPVQTLAQQPPATATVQRVTEDCNHSVMAADATTATAATTTATKADPKPSSGGKRAAGNKSERSVRSGDKSKVEAEDGGMGLGSTKQQHLERLGGLKQQQQSWGQWMHILLLWMLACMGEFLPGL